MTSTPFGRPRHGPRRAQHGPSPAHGLAELRDLIATALAARPAVAGIGPIDAGRFDRQADLPTGEVATSHPVTLPGRRHRSASRPETGASVPPTPVTDDEHADTWDLVRRAQEGDGEAFGALYDAYVDTVYRYIFFRVRDRGLAEDFTSETFLRALRRIRSVSYQGRDIGAWFVTIARNIVFDHAKSARTRLETVTDEPPEPATNPEPGPEQAVLTALSNESLMAAVNQLGDEQRECVTLRFLHGFSVAETAEVMGKKDGAIKAMQHRAVRRLAELIGGEL